MHDTDPKWTDSATAMPVRAGLDNGFRIGLAGFALEHATMQLPGPAVLPHRVRSSRPTVVEWYELDSSNLYPERPTDDARRSAAGLR